jgi:hypothetical protein
LYLVWRSFVKRDIATLDPTIRLEEPSDGLTDGTVGELSKKDGAVRREDSGTRGTESLK